jgi:hypothetical protein
MTGKGHSKWKISLSFDGLAAHEYVRRAFIAGFAPFSVAARRGAG